MPVKKKVKTPTVATISIPLYDHNIIAATNHNDLVEFSKEEFEGIITPDMELGAGGYVRTFHDEQTGGIVIIMYVTCIRTLAHESLHAAWAILDIVGVKCKANNHEALAYLMDYIFEVTRQAMDIK